MRWGLLTIRLGIIAVSLLIAAIVLLSTVPLAMGGLSVDMPDSEGRNPLEQSYEDGVITIFIPLDIYNGGYFDIEDFTLHLRVSGNGELFTETTSTPTNIVAGRDNRMVFSIALDLNGMDQEARRQLVFGSTDLSMYVEMEAGYALGLASMSARMFQNMEWDPLVSDVEVDTNAAQYRLNGTNVELTVPSSFRASPMIQGITVYLHATLRNATTEISHVDQTITIEEDNQNQIVFVIPGTVAQELSEGLDRDLILGLDLTFAGATFHQDYPLHWEGAP